MQGIQISSNLALLPGLPAVYAKAKKAVVISDLHLGFETAAVREGIYVPKVQLKRALELLKILASRSAAETLVINGDLKHVFEKLTVQEREEATKFLSAAKDYFSEIVLVEGNHDNYISVVASRFDVPIVDRLELAPDAIAVHGHKYDEKVLDYKYILIGHEHPSLKIPDELGGVLRLPSFLLVPLKNGSLAVVLPASGHYQTGNPATLDPGQYLSPLVRDLGLIGEAVPYVVDYGRATLEFPKLASLVAIP